MASEPTDDLRTQIDRMRSGIREITHDISNPLGVLRMATYFLQVAKPEIAKQEHYYKLIGEAVERVEAGLQRLRALSENPLMEIHDPPPAKEGT
jgi:nitrogen-specific signal transduction histidine kinase